MAGSVNKAIILGNLGRDPEIRHTRSGAKVASFSVATSDVWKDKQTGEKRERTEWHRVVVFNERLVEVAEKYLHKGSKVYLEGSNQTRKWTGHDGVERHTTEVVLQRFRGELALLDAKGNGGPPPADDPGAYGSTRTTDHGTPPDDGAPPNDLDDEIPF